MRGGGRFRRAHFLLGLEGLAILRRWWLDPNQAAERADEMRQILDRMDSDEFLSVTHDVPETDLATGYARWSQTYDDPGNPIVTAEQRCMRPLLDRLRGRVLDAACGTGRHAAYLRGAGKQVVAVDQSPEMLAKARQKAGDVEFQEASLTDLPFDDASFDAVVCALALAHFSELAPAVRELSRVVRPTGTILVSDVHPFVVILGGHAVYADAQERLGVMRNYYHQHSDYLRVFRDCRLEVLDCVEPVWSEPELEVMRVPLFPQLADEAIADVPIVLIWQLRRGVDETRS